MKDDIETFEKELNSIISICDEKIKCYRALLEEYQMIKGSALSLLNMNNNTKRRVVSLIDALKRLKYKLYSLMEKEGEHED
jgi:predicted ATPase